MADLARVLLTDKVRQMYDGRKSGILVVSRDDVSKGIYFRTGAVVFASSTVVEDRLSENLIRLGRISRAEFASVSDLHTLIGLDSGFVASLRPYLTVAP